MALLARGLAPRFVEAQRISPFSFRSTDVGVVLDMMIHDIDLILHLIDSDVRAVHAVGLAVVGDHETWPTPASSSRTGRSPTSPRPAWR